MRIEGWESLLNDYIAAAYREQFQYGKRDCALWCAEWVHKATGRDLLSQWKGQYNTEAGAAKLMYKRGFGTVADIAEAHLPQITVPMAKRGDIVLHPDMLLGICNGLNSYFITVDSITRVPTLNCLRAWKVE